MNDKMFIRGPKGKVQKKLAVDDVGEIRKVEELGTINALSRLQDFAIQEVVREEIAKLREKNKWRIRMSNVFFCCISSTVPTVEEVEARFRHFEPNPVNLDAADASFLRAAHHSYRDEQSIRPEDAEIFNEFQKLQGLNQKNSSRSAKEFDLALYMQTLDMRTSLARKYVHSLSGTSVPTVKLVGTPNQREREKFASLKNVEMSPKEFPRSRARSVTPPIPVSSDEVNDFRQKSGERTPLFEIAKFKSKKKKEKFQDEVSFVAPHEMRDDNESVDQNKVPQKRQTNFDAASFVPPHEKHESGLGIPLEEDAEQVFRPKSRVASLKSGIFSFLQSSKFKKSQKNDRSAKKKTPIRLVVPANLKISSKDRSLKTISDPPGLKEIEIRPPVESLTSWMVPSKSQVANDDTKTAAGETNFGEFYETESTGLKGTFNS